MARQARKPTASERNRRTQERIRKIEIEDVPTAAGGGGITDYVTMSGGAFDVTYGSSGAITAYPSMFTVAAGTALTADETNGYVIATAPGLYLANFYTEYFSDTVTGSVRLTWTADSEDIDTLPMPASNDVPQPVTQGTRLTYITQDLIDAYVSGGYAGFPFGVNIQTNVSAGSGEFKKGSYGGARLQVVRLA